MPRKEQGWITFQASDQERQLLEQICQQTQRSKTEVLRELLRTMGRSVAADTSSLDPVDLAEPGEAEFSQAPVKSGKIAIVPAVKLSARNLLEAKVKRVVRGIVSAEVTLTLAPDVELVAVITRSSADKLELKKGKSVFAVIKASNVMIGEL